MSEQLFIRFRSSRLHYHRFGHGKQWLFCFHGYGEEGATFRFLENELADTHTIIAFDMPFHGNTDWQEVLLLEPADLMGMMQQLAPPDSSFQLMGYSMGGRICLRLLERYPQTISSLILVAPDGLHKNPWQKFVTQTWVGNRLFRITMQYPGWMFMLMKLATQLGLFNKSISKFAHHYLDDALEREKLYKRWTTMRKFRPRVQRLKNIIKNREVPVHLLFGKYDRVILSKHGYGLQQGLEQLITVKEIEAGHYLLQEKFKAHFLSMLKS